MRRVIFCSLVALSVSLGSSVMAASTLDSGTVQKLAKIEQKYFGRTYDADSPDQRAQRIEKLIFGEASEGTTEQRMAKILAATHEAAADAIPTSAQMDGSEAPTAPQRPTPAPAPKAVAQTTAIAPSAGNTDAYPHITELEKSILGQSYVTQGLSTRLARMETKAFGKPSTDDDLSGRTDELEQYAEKKLHKQDFYQDPVAETSPSYSPTSASNSVQDDDGAQPQYPHITELEKTILAQSYAGQPLTERLGRMEAKAFGTASKSTDLSQRTDALERYAEKTLHKKPLPQGGQDETETASAGSPIKSGNKLLDKVGNAVLGMAGFTAGPQGMGLGGIGLGGMGAGGPGGFGGVRVRPRTTAQESEAEPEVPEEDPALHRATPPPPDSKLLTKVGWCEVQVFGHPCPNMHLPQRLRQLNDELNFDPGKSSLALMDDIGGLMKSVQARQGKSIGSKPQPVVR